MYGRNLLFSLGFVNDAFSVVSKSRVATWFVHRSVLKTVSFARKNLSVSIFIIWNIIFPDFHTIPYYLLESNYFKRVSLTFNNKNKLVHPYVLFILVTQKLSTDHVFEIKYITITIRFLTSLPKQTYVLYPL